MTRDYKNITIEVLGTTVAFGEVWFRTVWQFLLLLLVVVVKVVVVA